jgi:hypothetical protein
LTATTTDVAGNTSEFSAAVPISAAPDTDGDGLPDDYETIAGLNPNVSGDAGLDLDNDGSTNRNEFVAGTDASRASSVLKLQLLTMDQTAEVSFPSVIGKTYRVEGANNLTGPWVILGDTLAGTGSILRLAEVFGNTNTRFYRVRVTSN